MAAPPLDWNDLRCLLAVAREGSTLAAARTLRISQTTVARRLAALEEALGLVLFERRQAGYALTPAGEALLPQAEAVAAQAEQFAEAAAAQSRDASGTVRLTTVDIYGVTVLQPLLRDLHEAHPAVRIELDMAEAVRDIGAGEADVALRADWTDRSLAGGLVGRRVAFDPWTLYCSRTYAAAHSRPRTSAELRRHPFIGGGGDGVWRPYRAWLKAHGLEEAVVMQHSSAAGLLAAIRAGVGFAILPSFVGDREPDLVRVLPPPPGKGYDLWLLTHERLRHVPRVRAVMDFLGGALARLAQETPEEDPGVWAA